MFFLVQVLASLFLISRNVSDFLCWFTFLLRKSNNYFTASLQRRRGRSHQGTVARGSCLVNTKLLKVEDTSLGMVLGWWVAGEWSLKLCPAFAVFSSPLSFSVIAPSFFLPASLPSLLLSFPVVESNPGPRACRTSSLLISFSSRPPAQPSPQLLYFLFWARSLLLRLTLNSLHSLVRPELVVLLLLPSQYWDSRLLPSSTSCGLMCFFLH